MKEIVTPEAQPGVSPWSDDAPEPFAQRFFALCKLSLCLVNGFLLWLEPLAFLRQVSLFDICWYKVQSMPPSHRRLPQAPLSKMTSSRHLTPCPAVTFDLYGAPSRGLGVPMCELLTRSGGALERMLVDANDDVGAQMSGSAGFRKVNLKILWPGYEHLDQTYPIDISPVTGPLTRGQLAVQVARAFARFMEELHNYTPTQHGTSWRFGDGGINFNRLLLSACWNVCDDVWLSEVIVDFR